MAEGIQVIVLDSEFLKTRKQWNRISSSVCESHKDFGRTYTPYKGKGNE